MSCKSVIKDTYIENVIKLGELQQLWVAVMNWESEGQKC